MKLSFLDVDGSLTDRLNVVGERKKEIQEAISIIVTNTEPPSAFNVMVKINDHLNLSIEEWVCVAFSIGMNEGAKL